MKNKFSYIVTPMVIFATLLFGFMYHQSLRKEVSWQELMVLVEVSSKRDYCATIGLIGSKESELFYSTINNVYSPNSDKSREKQIIIEEKYKQLVSDGVQVYNDSPDKNNPVIHTMLKGFCQGVEEQAINLRNKYN